MKIIHSKIHGVLDYVVGLILITSPWIFSFADGSAAQWVPMILGVAALVYSLITDYELGAAKLISFKMHLMLDKSSGVLLAVSPWLFGFSDPIYAPHLVFGLLEIVVAMTTTTAPSLHSFNNTKHSHAV